MRVLGGDSIRDPRPQPISGSSYNFGEAIARSQRPPDQDFIDKLDEVTLRLFSTFLD